MLNNYSHNYIYKDKTKVSLKKKKKVLEIESVILPNGEFKNDENFEKTVDLFISYFENGGVHFQLNYVSKEDLVCAKQTPDDYKHLRVRVSGFSDYFVKLGEGLQDDIIARTEQK